MTFIAGCVAGFLIFLFVRVYGEDEPRRPEQPVSANTSSRASSPPSLLEARVGALPLVGDGGAMHEEQRGSPDRLRLEDTQRPNQVSASASRATDP